MRQRSERALKILAVATAGALVGVASLGAGAGAEPPDHAGPGTLPMLPFASKAPTGATGPDDLTRLAVEGLDGGKPLIWTAFQNGIGADGAPAGAQSTVAGFDPSSAALVTTIAVTGKVDGLTADPERGRLIATVNEDRNSAFNLIDPATGTVTTYSYSPDPATGTPPMTNGGTDSIAVRDGRIFVVHSNPNDTAQPTEYEVTLVNSTHTAKLRSVFFDDSAATDAVSGQPTTLGLTDPDTNYVMPDASPRFAGQLATVGQADGQIVFGSKVGKLQVLNLMDPPGLNAPPIVDGLAVATSGAGTLYVVDAKAGVIQAFDTSGWPAGTVFVSEPSDNNHPLLGTLDLSTGQITALGNTFVSPKELLFVPAHEAERADG
jgi:hypothetical protein